MLNQKKPPVNATPARPLKLVLQDQDGNTVESWDLIYMVGDQPNKEQFNMNQCQTNAEGLALLDQIRRRTMHLRWGGK